MGGGWGREGREGRGCLGEGGVGERGRELKGVGISPKKAKSDVDTCGRIGRGK